ncbi:putative holin-like toxin [Enterococcus faecalis]|uniref:putative holin-like toxin n=1 Tax=Enterococcus faecalis TaxID=1351 RepID=UPI0019158A75|nr:putative holin-like toxin [Enterococcus faecalis]
MSVFEALSLMIAFATLVLLIIDHTNKKKITIFQLWPVKMVKNYFIQATVFLTVLQESCVSAQLSFRL